MALKAVVFDVGETLVDETGMWERAADAAGIPASRSWACSARSAPEVLEDV